MSAMFSNSDEPTIDMYVAERCEHFPMMHIRPAVVEDADDLMPIFSQYSSEVNEEYGQFNCGAGNGTCNMWSETSTTLCNIPMSLS